MSEIFSSEIKLFNLEDVNKNIARFKVPLCYAGVANGFDFSKEVIEGMVNTIKGSPVLAYYDEQANDFGGHESDLYISNGVRKRTPSLSPIGFAIYDQDAWWEKFNFDGTEREYYTTFVYLWKDRNPELENLKQVYQSMEVELDYDNSNNNLKKVKSATFQGMAMLGSSVLPAFKGSTFIKFSSDDLNILKQEFEQIKFKGGENVFYGLTSNQLRSRLDSALSPFTYTSGEYEYRKYWVDDFGADSVFVCDESDNNYYVINYQYVEGKCVLDMATKVPAEETYKPITFAKKVEAFLQKDEYGTGEKLELDLTKDSASNDSWGSVNKTSLRNQIAKSSNWKSAKSKCYVISEGDNASDWKYPICQIKDNKLVYNVNGVQAAWSMLAKETSESYYDSAKAELKKIYKKLGLDTSTFTEKGGENQTMKDFKAMYSKMQESKSKFCLDDSEDMLCLIDSDAQCIYILDGEGTVTKIPYEVNDPQESGDEGTFVAKEDAKQEMPDSKEMMMSLAKMSVAEKEKITAEMSAKDVEIGKAFSSISSLETALAENKTVMAERDAQIAELSKKLKAKDDAEKMSKVDTLMSKKEFSVFNDEEKQAFKNKASEMLYDQFENMVYSTFGKKVKDNINFENGSKNFSLMYVDNAPPVHHENKDDKDIYADLREKSNK